MLFMLVHHLWFLLAAAAVGVALGWWASAPGADDPAETGAGAVTEGQARSGRPLR